MREDRHGNRRLAARSHPRPSSTSEPQPFVILVERRDTCIGKEIESELGLQIERARSYADAVSLLVEKKSCLAAVVDLKLPDAPKGQIVDLMLENGLPTIVLTHTFDPQRLEEILNKGIVDYYLNDEMAAASVIETLRRLRRNPGRKVLVVDDSSVARLLIRQMLSAHQLQVLLAEDGGAGLAAVEQNPDIDLVLADYDMPDINGLKMVRKIRSSRGRDELAIIGLSALGSSSMSAAFLKHGADDFLNKPFQKEEFYCRVYRSLETLDQIKEIKRAAFTDQLTGLPNRLCFFKTVPALFEQAASAGRQLMVAMLDIDHFKSINDTYGHTGSDAALRHISALVTDILGELDIVARLGWEEFCVVDTTIDGARAASLLDKLRRTVEASVVAFEGDELRFTLCAGLTMSPRGSLDDTINYADQLLYQAKEQGRNQVVVEPAANDEAKRK